MPRKSPYEHKVGSHQRRTANGDMITIDNYTRGSGKAPRMQKGTGSLSLDNPGSDFKVTFYFSSGRETYPVEGETLTEALRTAIPLMQRPEVSRHAQIRRAS